MNGATQIRAGVMRPEIVIPLRADARTGAVSEAVTGRLAIGAPVRVIRDPYFGLIGRVTALPPEPQTLQSGSKARVLEVTFESGEGVIIPRANVELIEGAGGQEPVMPHDGVVRPDAYLVSRAARHALRSRARLHLAARRGLPIKVRRIAGLEAVDEAVGRATEMGRSCLFIPGIQDMNDIQTIAALTVLVAAWPRRPRSTTRGSRCRPARSLVMTAARETVQAAYLAAGRPEAFTTRTRSTTSPTSSSGTSRTCRGSWCASKPAACFYMGSFFAESLILAETGNGVGAIQIAGTAQPAQLPFFVAACDYTLIGEEFFAASAYLSGEPDQLGSLKGQDVGKLIVAAGIITGVAAATLVQPHGIARDPIASSTYFINRMLT